MKTNNKKTTTTSAPAIAAAGIQIIQNRPMPSAQKGPGSANYPFATMRPGDSFDLPANKTKAQAFAIAAAATQNHGKGNNKNFKARIVSQKDGVVLMGIWCEAGEPTLRPRKAKTVVIPAATSPENAPVEHVAQNA